MTGVVESKMEDMTFSIKLKRIHQWATLVKAMKELLSWLRKIRGKSTTFQVNDSQFDAIGIWQLVYSAHVKWPGRPLQFIPMTVVTTLLFMKGSMRKSKLGFISVPRVFETPWDVRRGKVDSDKITVYYEIIIL